MITTKCIFFNITFNLSGSISFTKSSCFIAFSVFGPVSFFDPPENPPKRSSKALVGTLCLVAKESYTTSKQ